MNSIRSPLEQEAAQILRLLREQGYDTYWAGGCVRDKLLGRPPKDIDIATGARPEDIARLFPHAKEVGRAFGVMLIPSGDHAFEVSTFRKDRAYVDGRHPTSVEFTEAEEDARRRDFTINALFYDPVEDRVVDYVNGQRDLKDRLIRAIGRPDDRFAEDHLRLLRAVRFASVLQFCIEPGTFSAIQRLAPMIHRISAERIQQELTRLLLESPRAGDGLVLLRESGLLKEILPEVERMAGQEQPPEFHPEGDVFTHTAMMLNEMKEPTLHLAYGILLHDVGKPPTASLGTDADGRPRIRFNNHATVGAGIAEDILERLRFSNHDREAIVHSVRNHMRFMDVRRMRRSTLRRLIRSPHFPTELELHRVDCLCSHGDLSNVDFLTERLAEIRAEPVLPPRWVTGRDLIALGVPEGPRIGEWLNKAYEWQLEGVCRDREETLARLRTELASAPDTGAPSE